MDWKTDLSQCYTLLGTEADLEPEIDLDTNPTFIGEFPMRVIRFHMNECLNVTCPRYCFLGPLTNRKYTLLLSIK